MGKKTELGPGWAHNGRGFTFQHDGKAHPATCQEVTGQDPETGESRACGITARYARTLWDAGVVFCCGRHRDRMEEFARPLVAMGSRGAAIMRPLIAAPLQWEVPGAAEPVEHPVHVGVREDGDGQTLCWCGAAMGTGEFGQTAWTGGEPVDTPWWERQGAQPAAAGAS